jgi:hypothetical protein
VQVLERSVQVLERSVQVLERLVQVQVLERLVQVQVLERSELDGYFVAFASPTQRAVWQLFASE